MAGGLHPKVTGSALAGAFVGLLVAEAQRRGVTLDANESADLVVVVSFIVGYFVPNGDSGGTSSNGGNHDNVNGGGWIGPGMAAQQNALAGASTAPAATASPSATPIATPSMPPVMTLPLAPVPPGATGAAS